MRTSKTKTIWALKNQLHHFKIIIVLKAVHKR
jgi:hypothetical protein